MQVWLGQLAPPSVLSSPPSALSAPPSTDVHALLSLQVVPSAWLLHAVGLAVSQIWHESAGLLAPFA
jgi:hypothetical protein